MRSCCETPGVRASLALMDLVFAAIEQTPFSVWMREDLYAFFIALIFHSLGMALLVGGGVVVSLAAVGLHRTAPLEKFRGFFPVMWFGAALAVSPALRCCQAIRPRR